MQGVYRIVNLTNNKVYIGSSRRIENRWKVHLGNLRNNKHTNQHLQNSWNKHGESNFKFEVIEQVEEGNITKVEEDYINSTKSYIRSFGYNIIRNTLDLSRMSGKQIEVINLLNKETKIYNSLQDIKRTFGLSPETILKRINKKLYKDHLIFKLPGESLLPYNRIQTKEDIIKPIEDRRLFLLSMNNEVIKIFYSRRECGEFIGKTRERIRQCVATRKYAKVKYNGEYCYLLNKEKISKKLKSLAEKRERENN